MLSKTTFLHPGRTIGLTLLVALGMSACGSKEDAQSVTNADTATQAAKQTETKPEPQTLPPPADVAAVPDGAEKSASGLAWRVLVAGAGTEHPGPASRVEVHYSGWTTDGEMFDSSRVSGESMTMSLNRVITGWTEGVQLMVAGEQRRFWIPPELAYRNSKRPGAPQGMLVFDIELIDIKD